MSISGEDRIGITVGAKNRDGEYVAIFSHKEDASDADIVASSGAELVNIKIGARDTDAGTVKFTVSGKGASSMEGDVTLEASGTTSGSGTKNITVVIPWRIRTPYPEFEGEVEPRVQVLDSTTSPSAPDRQGRITYAILWGKELTVVVEDKWGNLIGELYEGSEITEGNIPINQTLQADSTYTDPVDYGYAWAKVDPNGPPPINPQNPDKPWTRENWEAADPVAQALEAIQKGEIPATGMFDVSRAVEVDKFSLEGGTGPRTIYRKGMKYIKIKWPAE